MCDDKTWELIKAEYIAGGMSYADLAQKYGVPKGTIGKKAAAQGWTALQKRVRNETETKVASSIADNQADHFVKLYGMADRFQERMQELLDMPVRNGRDAHDMVDALNGTVQLLRDLYGLPSEQQLQGRERLKIMREQLEIQKKQQAIASGEDVPQERWVIDYG